MWVTVRQRGKCALDIECSLRHLNYTKSDNDRLVYGNLGDMFIADLILLMFDASDELTAVGYPVV
jgi:hypothetical protein